MPYLNDMQAHLDDARRQIEELEATKTELIGELRDVQKQRDKAEDMVDKTKLLYRILLAICIAFSVWVGMGNMEYASVNDRLEKQVLDLNQSDLQQRFDNVLEALHYQNNRTRELEDANEALMRECDPSGRNRAIKATPLPAIVRGV